MINRIIHKWSFHIKFIKLAEGSFNIWFNFIWNDHSCEILCILSSTTNAFRRVMSCLVIFHWVIFHAISFVCWPFRKIIFFKNFFQEHYQSVKQFGSRSGLTFCQSWSGSKLFPKVINRLYNFAAGKERVMVKNHAFNECFEARLS